MQTIRKKIISMLQKECLNAKDIAVSLNIKEREVYEHLAHIVKTVKTQKKKLIITPFECRGCGFRFQNRKNFKSPGRCPECKQSRIDPACYQVK